MFIKNGLALLSSQCGQIFSQENCLRFALNLKAILCLFLLELHMLYVFILIKYETRYGLWVLGRPSVAIIVVSIGILT